MLSDDEILRRLKAVRNSPQHERNARRILSINSISQRTGINRTYIHNIIAGSAKIGPANRRKFSDVLTCHDREGERRIVPATTPSIEIRFSVEKWLN